MGRAEMSIEEWGEVMNPKQIKNENPHDMTDKKILLAGEVCSRFIKYLDSLQEFKNAVGLKEVPNIHEVLSSMSDKHGRICREVKHLEREDPRDNWANEMMESMSGYLAYMAMIIRRYNLSSEIRIGMYSELIKAVEQHSEEKSNHTQKIKRDGEDQ
jgi:ATP/ADP translocase